MGCPIRPRGTPDPIANLESLCASYPSNARPARLACRPTPCGTEPAQERERECLVRPHRPTSRRNSLWASGPASPTSSAIDRSRRIQRDATRVLKVCRPSPIARPGRGGTTPVDASARSYQHRGPYSHSATRLRVGSRHPWLRQLRRPRNTTVATTARLLAQCIVFRSSASRSRNRVPRQREPPPDRADGYRIGIA